MASRCARLVWLVAALCLGGAWAQVPGAVAAPGRPVSLREAVKAAVAQNPALLTPGISADEATGLVGATQRRWIPNPSISARYGWAQTPVIGPLYSYFSSYDQAVTTNLSFSAGLIGEIPVTSTRYSLGVNLVRSTNSRIDELLGTQVNLVPTLEVTQPLLRAGSGRPYSLTMDGLREGRRGAQAAERLALQEGVLRAAEAYLFAVRAQRVVDVRLQAVQSAEQALSATEKLLASGRTIAESLVAAKAELTRRQREVVEARSAELRAVTGMLEASFLDQDPEYARTHLALAFEPYETERPDAEALVGEVLAGHPVLEQQQARVAQASAGYDLAMNQRLPDLSLTGRVGLTGVGGDTSCVGGVLRDGVTPCGVSPAIGAGSVPGAFATLGKYPQWEVGAQLSFPLGDSVAWSGVVSAEAALKRATVEYEGAKTRLATEARTRLIEYDLGRERVQSARLATDLAEQTHQQVTKRFQMGGATVFDLFRALDTLYFAREAQTGAEIDLARLAIRLDEIRPGRLLTHFDLSAPPKEGAR